MARLLVIDDDEILRETIVSGLRQAGHIVVPASTGREGTRLFRLEPADAVITEIVVPDQDGLETVTELRKDFPDVPIIAISGRSAHAPLYLRLAARLGARRTLAKPFTVPDLLSVIDEVLAEDPGQPPADKSVS